MRRSLNLWLSLSGVAALSLANSLLPSKASASEGVAVQCHFAGDGIVETRSGYALYDWQISKFTSEKGKRKFAGYADDFGVCTLRMDAAAYRWVACFRDNGEYRFSDSRKINSSLLQVVKSGYPRCYRCSQEEASKWHGGCKISR